MLPHVMAFNQNAVPERMRWISDALGAEAESASEAVASLISELDMPTRLRDVGVKKSHFGAIADGAMLNAFVRANVKEIKREDVITLLERAY